MPSEYENPSLDLSAKRQTSSSSEFSNFSLNDLQELLIEVLLRLRTFKSASLCKCVCKNWYSLISSPYFARRFIAHHYDHQHKQNPSTLLINYFSKDYVHRLVQVSDEPIFKSCRFDLNYLPVEHGSVNVIAVYKDLMLCTDDCSYKKFRSWVCNPFTKQWVALPLCEIDKGQFLERIGFICEPYYFENSQGECAFNCNYRFRVILMTREYSIHHIWTYCSETQKWNKSVFKDDKYGWYDSNVVAYNGKFLWCNDNGWTDRCSIFAYDPFNPDPSTFIDCSYIHSIGSSDGYFYCIGVCKGFLRMMLLAGWGTSQSLAIWELKDVGTGQWSLEDKVFLETVIPENSSAHEIVNRSGNQLKPLGFHPSNEDIVYLHVDAFIIYCSMRTRELKMVGELPCKYFQATRSVFHFELPLWPTPVQRLFNG